MAQFVRTDSEIRQKLVRSSSVFIEESLKFIQSMVINGKLSQERGRRYIKEILHSIFFIGYINQEKQSKRRKHNERFIHLPIYPDDVLRADLHSKLSQKFPDLFDLFKTVNSKQRVILPLPRRPPFSVLLEVVVETTVGRDDSADDSAVDSAVDSADDSAVDSAVDSVDDSADDSAVNSVLGVLAKLSDEMIIHRSEGKSCGNDFLLGASVVSYSYFKRKQRTKNYFGASMSCKGRTATKIFINLACIETWNRNVARAVCLAEKHNKFIKLPETVYSKAYSLCLSQKGKNYRVQEGENDSDTNIDLSPCLLCQEIFPDVKFSPPPTGDPDKPSWNYGNCAECEAISNLLNGEPSVSEETELLNTELEPSLEKLRKKRENELRGHLNNCKVKLNKGYTFYNP